MHTLISAQAGCTDIDISPSPYYFIYFSIERDNQQIDLYIHIHTLYICFFSRCHYSLNCCLTASTAVWVCTHLHTHTLSLELLLEPTLIPQNTVLMTLYDRWCPTISYHLSRMRICHLYNSAPDVKPSAWVYYALPLTFSSRQLSVQPSILS